METQLRITLEDLAKNLDHGKQGDIILLDFAKAFDTVPHQRLLSKLSHYGVQDTFNISFFNAIKIMYRKKNSWKRLSEEKNCMQHKCKRKLMGKKG